MLWYNLDPDRRYMLLDGFTIQIFDDDGTPVAAPDGLRSLASVVKNERHHGRRQLARVPGRPRLSRQRSRSSVVEDETATAPSQCHCSTTTSR